MKRDRGYSLVEIMVVAGIIAILTRIAVPVYSQYTKRAKASEAVAAMAMIRQAARDYNINNNTYFDVASGNIQNVPTSGLEVDVGVAQYFSNHSYTVNATSMTIPHPRFTTPDPVDFIITADGSASVACGGSNCALHNGSVSGYRLEIDNSGRIFVSYDGGANWSSY